MKAKYLKILLKPKAERKLWELLYMIKFYRNATNQEFKYAMGLEYYFTNKFTN